jgi:hypothetical protein
MDQTFAEGFNRYVKIGNRALAESKEAQREKPMQDQGHFGPLIDQHF